MVDRRAKLLLTLALLVAAGIGPAAALDPVEKASYEVLTDRTAYQPGETARIAVRLSIESGWHVNSNPATFDWLIPTTVTIEPPEGWPEASVSYPEGEIQTFGFSEEPLSVYDGEVTLMARIDVPATAAEGAQPLTVGLLYQSCDDRVCLAPVELDIPLQVMIGAGGQAVAPEVFAESTGSVAPARAAQDGPNLAWILLLGVVGGLILNVMPCVLPILSLKIFGLVKSAAGGRGRVVAGSLATTAGILVSFWALALAAVVAKTAGAAVGWGVQFQNPVFVAALAVVIVLFSLNLWGLFEIPLPASLARVGSSGPREGVAGHFASGLFSTLMATPCSAPFLGTAVGFALGQSGATVFAVFTAVGVGLALPYIVLALFPGAARFLPKPGAWMDTMRGVLGFLLAAAAIWLLYVMAAQIDSVRLAFVEVGLLGLALFTWLKKRATPGGLWSKALFAAALLTAVGTVLIPRGAAPASASSGTEVHAGLLDWVPFDSAEAERTAAAGTPVFVDVTADWCFTCKFNERLVLETPTIDEAFERHGVVAMRADWTNRNAEIGAYLESFGRYGIPFYVLYRPGDEPYVFSELLTQATLLEALGTLSQTRTASR